MYVTVMLISFSSLLIVCLMTRFIIMAKINDSVATTQTYAYTTLWQSFNLVRRITYI
jgi:hypothetical protein